MNLSDKIRKAKWYAEWKKQVKRLNNHRCVKCGTTENIEVHHIIPLATIIRLCGLKNIRMAKVCTYLISAENGECRCHKCHQEVINEEMAP